MSLFSALSNPYSFGYPGTPTISEHVTESRGPNLPMPDSMGPPGGMITRDSRGSHYDAGVQQTNGNDTRKYLQDCSERKPGDTVKGMPTFEYVERPNDSANSGNFLNVKPKIMYSWSTMHYMLKYSAKMRKMFGSITSGVGTMEKHFPFLGIQQLDQSRLDASYGILEYTDINLFTVQGRTNNVHNVWTLGKPDGTSVSELSVLMGLWRRHPYNGDEAMEDAVWQPQPANSLLFDINRVNYRHRHAQDRLLDARHHARATAQSNLPFPAFNEANNETRMDELFSCMTSTKPNDPNQTLMSTVKVDQFTECLSNYRSSYDLRTPESAQQEWYWSLDPYVSDDRKYPPFALYNAAHYSGSVVIFGTVVHVTRGDNNATPASQARASRGLYPNVRSTDYMQELFNLDQLEVHVGVGKMIAG
jgi:hypothetical protein